MPSSRLNWSRSTKDPLAERIIQTARQQGKTINQFISEILEANV